MASRTRLPFTRQVIELIRSIPEGKVASYGQIARLAGCPQGARQVARILHTSSKKEALPWHRVINKKGSISLKGLQKEEQRLLLEAEGVVFEADGTINLSFFGWQPSSPEAPEII